MTQKLTHVNGLISTAEEHYEKLFWMMCVWLLIQCLHCSASLELHLDNSAP